MIYKMVGREKRNFVKLKVLLVLSRVPSGTRVDIEYIASHTGSNKASLYTLLKRWVRWEYVKGAIDENGQRWYMLAPRGRAYLKAAAKWYPALNKVRHEVLVFSSERCWWREPESGRVYIVYRDAAKDEMYINSPEDAQGKPGKRLRFLGIELRKATSLDDFKEKAGRWITSRPPPGVYRHVRKPG